MLFFFEQAHIDKIKNIGINIYKKDVEGLEEALLQLSSKYGFTSKEKKKSESFHCDLKIYLRKTQDISIMDWFREMAFLYVRYHLVPPYYFFNLVKIFLALDGIQKIVHSKTTAQELLFEQFHQYYILHEVKKFKEQTVQILGNGRIIAEVVYQELKNFVSEILPESGEQLIEKIEDIVKCLKNQLK